jgi:TPP-dependent 2-oxoacid decarboxylase
LQVIEDSLPGNAIVALDSTQLGYSAHWWLPASRSRSWLAPYGFGTLGCALPMAIGASVAAPQRPVLAIVGDGGWLFSVAEMAVAHDLSQRITLLLWDNSDYEQIRESFDDVDAPRIGVDVSSHDPCTIARGFGWKTSEVTNQILCGCAYNPSARVIASTKRCGEPAHVSISVGPSSTEYSPSTCATTMGVTPPAARLTSSGWSLR